MATKKKLLILLLVAPLVIYFDVLVLGFTISSNEVSIDSSIRFGNLLAVADPSAGSFQDHPWLFKIGKSLRQGSVPFINLQNGLGAPLIESLQSGVLYPLNILLIFMELSSSQFFDLFSVLHALILTINSFFLFKLYVPSAWSVILAHCFVFPLTFTQINMVHYRAFAWTPLMVWASICIARGNIRPNTILVTVSATICSITAGNPQESFFGLLLVLVIFIAETIRLRSFSWRRVIVSVVSFTSGICIASPSIFPYLTAKSKGLLSSVDMDVSRSSTLISAKWITGWLIPYINGAYPDFYRTSKIHDEFSTFAIHPVFLILIIAGLVINLNIKTRVNNWSNKLVLLLILFFGLAGILSTTDISPFQGLIRSVPFVNTIRITKYVNYIHLTLAICAAFSLSLLIKLPSRAHRQVIILSLALFSTLVLLVCGFELSDRTWNFNWHRLDQVLLIWIGWSISIIAFAYFLLSNKASNYFLLLTLIIASLMMKPYGFFKSLDSYSSFPISDLDFSKERIFSRADTPNSNLLNGYTRIEVFDPVLNKSFADVFTNSFSTLSPNFLLQASKETIITKAQINLLQLMGATSIYGYKVEDSSSVKKITGNFTKIQDSLPHLFLLDAVENIESACRSRDYSKAVELIRQSIIALPAQDLYIGVNDLMFRLNQSGTGTLVSLTAFSPGWQINGQSPSKFCGLFNAWQGEFTSQRNYQIAYVPLGLRTSYGLAAFGILLLLLAVKLT